MALKLRSLILNAMVCILFIFVGNKNTLWTLPREKNIDVREELLQFHSKWYSSNVMALAILGKGKVFCKKKKKLF